LYHHFADKQAIFRAVVTAESVAVANAIGAADTPDLPAFDRLVLGARSYIEAMREDGRVQLLLVEGPAILGRETIHQIEAQHGDAALKVGLQEAIASGALPDLPIDTLVSLLSAMFERAAIEATEGTAVSDILVVIETIIGGLAQTKGCGQSQDRF
jgi:AcrR family transcriptional regulator